jgi:uncharacterized protein (DUF433 family)
MREAVESSYWLVVRPSSHQPQNPVESVNLNLKTPPEKQKAMAYNIIDIGRLIIRTPEMRGGRPRIAGTGVTVRRIVGWYKLGLSPEEIADEFGHLSLAQVYAALTYYHANHEEIEADVAAEESEAERLEREHYQATRRVP